MNHTDYNETALVITDRVFSDGKYCSFRAAYGKVIKTLDDIDASDFIDENLYFKAIVKLGILIKGRLLKDGFIPEHNGSHYPPEDIAMIMIDDRDSSNSIYRRLRGSWGFNCDNEAELNTLALTPVAELLRTVNAELARLEEQIQVAKDAMREAKLPVSMIDGAGKRRAVIKRMLG